MKHFILAAVLVMGAALTGCNKVQALIKCVSPGLFKNPQMQAFSGLGNVVETKQGIEVTLSSDALFGKRGDRLSQAGLSKVDTIAAAILKFQGDHAEVKGYTDNTGNPAKNVKLTQRLADVIKKEMVRKGVGAFNVTAMGKGSAEPAAPNVNDADKAKNRRIVFEISAA